MKKIFFIGLLVYLAFVITSEINVLLNADFEDGFEMAEVLLKEAITLWAYGLLAGYSFEKLKK